MEDNGSLCEWSELTLNWKVFALSVSPILSPRRSLHGLSMPSSDLAVEILVEEINECQITPGKFLSHSCFENGKRALAEPSSS